jgi:hypothetical protein
MGFREDPLSAIGEKGQQILPDHSQVVKNSPFGSCACFQPLSLLWCWLAGRVKEVASIRRILLVLTVVLMEVKGR